MQRNKSLAKNAIFSSIKTLCTIIFPFITYPYITRVLSVENIGRINFGNSIVSYFTLLGALGISGFAVRNGSRLRDNHSKLQIFSSQIFTINFIASIVSYILLIILTLLPTKIAGYKDIILAHGITVLVAPFAVEWLYVLEEDFAAITIRGIGVQIISLICMFIFVKNEGDTYKYVALCAIASCLGNVYNFIHSRKYVRIKLIQETKWREYKKAIFTFFINSITTVIYLNSDITLLGLWSTDYNIGLYSVATKIYSIVKQVFNAIVGVTIPRLSYLINSDRDAFYDLLRKMFSVVVIFILPAMIGIIILRKEIILLISGEAYLEADKSLAILNIAIVFAVFANILANGVLISLGKEDKVLKATVISAMANIGLNIICIPMWGEKGAALTTVIAEIIMFVFCAFCIRDMILKIINWKSLFCCILSTIVMMLVGSLFLYLGHDVHYVIRIITVVVSCVSVYFCTMLILKENICIYCLGLIKNKFIKTNNKADKY